MHFTGAKSSPLILLLLTHKKKSAHRGSKKYFVNYGLVNLLGKIKWDLEKQSVLAWSRECKTVSQNDQEILQSQTADQPTAQ